MKLSQFYSRGRDNNFNLIRLLAAIAVLFSHSFTVALGTRDAEPLRPILGISIGYIAVDVFFITSGFLVSGSLLSRKNILEFILARILRIYPALVVSTLLTVFVIGLVSTTETASAFLTSGETLHFLFANMSMLAGAFAALPGVFESVPFKTTVNASLWTLPSEVRLYMLLAIIWLSLLVFSKTHISRIKAFNFFILLFAAVAGVVHITGHFAFFSGDVSKFILFNPQVSYVRFFFMFFTGAAFFVLKERIIISRNIFSAVLLANVASALIGTSIFFITYNLSLAYLLFFLAYVPAGKIRRFNNVGDYSFGMYLYAFPIQQSIAMLIPNASVGTVMIIALPVTFTLAFFSWHLIEKHALRLKGSFMWFRRSLQPAPMPIKVDSD